jgi:hypothetical protein
VYANISMMSLFGSHGSKKRNNIFFKGMNAMPCLIQYHRNLPHQSLFDYIEEESKKFLKSGLSGYHISNEIPLEKTHSIQSIKSNH